jgi:hypothetical protein
MKIGAKWVGTSDEDGDRPKTTDGGKKVVYVLWFWCVESENIFSYYLVSIANHYGLPPMTAQIPDL